MKINDEQFNRLMKAARPAFSHDNADLPFGTQTRIVAQWQSSRDPVESHELRRLFRIGLACACVVVVVIAAATLRELSQPEAPSLAVQDAVINLAFTK